VKANDVVKGREALLATAFQAFFQNPDVRGIFLAGSLAAGTADAYSDIDLRVVVAPEKHRWFVEHRRQIPNTWPGFLFNEWLPRTQHCVSHFRPFNKIDIFYYAADTLKPSPWYTLPITVLHDPDGLVADLIARSAGLSFEVAEDEVDYSISKGLAAAHEAFRRSRRGELFYAQTLLDEFRQHIMRADDWLFDRTPASALNAKFDRRGSNRVLAGLGASFCGYDATALERSILELAHLYRDQILKLHEKFTLARSLDNDLAAVDVLVSEKSCTIASTLLTRPLGPPR
jgi:hypothetical protein